MRQSRRRQSSADHAESGESVQLWCRYAKDPLGIVKTNFAVTVSAAMVVSVLATACEELVYHPEELAAKKRFASIVVGQTDVQLRATLGRPLGTIMNDSSAGIARYVSEDSGNANTMDLKGSRADWPAELKFLPRQAPASKIFVYRFATVSAYYYVDNDGRIDLVNVHIN